MIGIPKAGTADYRRAALLFRASVTPKDALVLQFAQPGTAQQPPDCSVFPPPGAGETTFTVSGVNRSGDLVVTDVPPFPTSKDRCKHGGWRNFGSAFKNEGGCVSFVANGGRKPPQG